MIKIDKSFVFCFIFFFMFFFLFFFFNYNRVVDSYVFTHICLKGCFLFASDCKFNFYLLKSCLSYQLKSCNIFLISVRTQGDNSVSADYTFKKKEVHLYFTGSQEIDSIKFVDTAYLPDTLYWIASIVKGSSGIYFTVSALTYHLSL